MNVAISQKSCVAQILTRKMTGNGMNQNPENWQGVKYGNQACNNTTIDEIWGGYTQIKKQKSLELISTHYVAGGKGTFTTVSNTQHIGANCHLFSSGGLARPC